MAKQRIVNTKFWDDSYIVRLSPATKLVFLYFLTNPLTNISGVYELPLRRVAFDVGIPEGEIQEIIDKFIADGKIIYADGWVAVVNFIKFQAFQNPKVRQGIASELKKAPRAIVAKLTVAPEIHYDFNEGMSVAGEGRIQDSPRLNGLRSIREILPTLDSIKRR